MLPYRRARAVLHTVEEQYWYAGPLSERKAEEALCRMNNSPGLFLVRDSLLPDADFFLSLLGHDATIHHYPIHLGMDCSCTLNGYTFEDLPTCISFYCENRIGGVFLQTPLAPLLNQSEIPLAQVQPVIRTAATKQYSSAGDDSSRKSLLPSSLPVREADSKQMVEPSKPAPSAPMAVCDSTYASLEDDEVESMYASQQLLTGCDHTYDSVMNYHDTSKAKGRELEGRGEGGGGGERGEVRGGGGDSMASKGVCGGVFGAIETGRDATASTVASSPPVSLIHFTVEEAIYTVPKKNRKADKHCRAVEPPRSHLTPKYCSTLRYEDEQCSNMCEQTTKKAGPPSITFSSSSSSSVPLSFQPTRHTLQLTNKPAIVEPAASKFQPVVAKGLRRPPPPPPSHPPPPPPPQCQPSVAMGSLKRNDSGRLPFRRGSVGDLQLLPSGGYLMAKAVPTAIVASFGRPEFPSSLANVEKGAGEQRKALSYGYKVPYSSRGGKGKPPVISAHSSPAVLETTATTASSSSSSQQSKKEKKKSKRKIFFRFK